MKACIVGTGVVTGVGHDVASTAAAVRAHLTNFQSSHMIDKAGEPMILSMAQFIPFEVRGAERLLALALPAAKEALAPLLANSRSAREIPAVAVCMGFGTPRPGFNPIHLEQQIVARLESETGIALSKTQRFAVSAGHASGILGIERAVQMIDSGGVEFVVVGVVDSYYDPDLLEWLDESKRLHSDENKDGFIPGEGAGFCLITSPSIAERYGLRALTTVLSVASGEEPYPFTSNGISIGEGLTTVLRRALDVGARDKGVAADWTICDMNGESFRASEWTYAYLRTTSRHRDPLEIWHPANCYGDIGAASGLVLVAIATAAWQRNYARGNRCLVWASSDGPQRAAVLLEQNRNLNATRIDGRNS
jgi:3-oxoacyl-[acyl-carrier-protein] synthase-1